MYGVDVDHAFFIDNVNGDFLDLAMRMGRLLLTVPDVTAPFECYLAHEPSIAKGIAQGNPASLWVAFLFYSWARYAPVTFVEDVFDYSIEQCVNVLDECQTVSRQPERANAIELANLIELINSKFKLRQRVALLAVANSPEMRLPLKDLAAVPELDWVQPFNRAIEGLQRAANKLLRPEGWNLSRNSNDAVIKRHSQKPKAGSRQGKKRKKTGESLDR